jgi:hypothetical protein
MPTWICPLNSAHQFTGDWTNAWILYLNHFMASHTSQQAAFTLLPGTQPYALYADISSIFGKPTQIDWIIGTVSWYSKSGSTGYHFYLGYFKGIGDRVTFPSKMRDFHGIPGASGLFQLGKLPSDPISGRPNNRIDLDRALQDILISSYPATQSDDYLTKADIIIKGWV